MKYFKKHIGLQLKEEALLIDGMRKIALIHAHQLTEEDEDTIADFENDFIDRDLNLRRTTWKRIENMFDRHGIKMPVDCSPRSMYRKDEGRWVSHLGNGGYYPNNKCKLSFEEAKTKRQTKRYEAWARASEQYKDIGDMMMNSDKVDKKMADLEKRAKALIEEANEIRREAGVPVKAAVIKISDYLPGRSEK